MNDRGSGSPKPVQIIFFVATDAYSSLNRLVYFGVKSTSITGPPDVIGNFLALVELFSNDETELFEFLYQLCYHFQHVFLIQACFPSSHQFFFTSVC
jgi:hypothetical protein